MSSRLLLIALVALSCAMTLAQRPPVRRLAQQYPDAAFGDPSSRQTRVGSNGFFDSMKKIGSGVANAVQGMFRMRAERRDDPSSGAPTPPGVVAQPMPVMPETPQIPIPVGGKRGGTAKCTSQDSGCFAAILRAGNANAGEDPLEQQLFTELKDIKASLDAHTRGISNEENWIANVQEIMKTYSDKIKAVRDHIIDEHKLIKDLNKKKHQLRTLIKQRRIEAQIQAATDALKAVQDEIDQVDGKKKEFDQNKDVLSSKITQLQQDLQHMSPGGSSAGSSGGSTGASGASGAASGAAASGASSSAAAAPAAAPAPAPAK